MKWIFLPLLISLSPVNAADADQLVRRDIPWGSSINLQDFGGPNVEVFVRAREISFIAVEVVDHTQTVPVARTNIQGVAVNRSNAATVYGTNQVILKPVKSSLRIEKKNGVRMPGTTSDLFLLYQNADSQLKVFFLDAISNQNHDWLVVSAPKAAAK